VAKAVPDHSSHLDDFSSGTGTSASIVSSMSMPLRVGRCVPSKMFDVRKDVLSRMTGDHQSAIDKGIIRTPPCANTNPAVSSMSKADILDKQVQGISIPHVSL